MNISSSCFIINFDFTEKGKQNKKRETCLIGGCLLKQILVIPFICRNLKNYVSYPSFTNPLMFGLIPILCYDIMDVSSSKLSFKACIIDAYCTIHCGEWRYMLAWMKNIQDCECASLWNIRNDNIYYHFDASKISLKLEILSVMNDQLLSRNFLRFFLISIQIPLSFCIVLLLCQIEWLDIVNRRVHTQLKSKIFSAKYFPPF